MKEGGYPSDQFPWKDKFPMSLLGVQLLEAFLKNLKQLCLEA